MTLTTEQIGNTAENWCFRFLLNVDEKMRIKMLNVLNIKLRYRLGIIKDWDVAETKIKKILGDAVYTESEDKE